MTSRRPMTRSYSGNGRTSSFSEEEGSSSNGRSESRNTYLSNVRPENSYSRYSHYRPTRSTLCSVMAQLTEDIQPSFETTLKSKAVSENCNVKFTCVVSGYPAPELTWYKDDMEMDRYCGLPKYEIRRNGKTHTLHIYNCTLDDAAIYQASANNSKGIVSCSGVLEVGTMNEYKIHQRFFAKLKQKAENKKKELEESKKKGKENVRRENARPSPERSQRKRPVPPPKENPVVQEPEAVEQLGAAALEPNGVGAEVRETAPVTSTENDVDSPTKKAKKKIKLSNGVDASGHAGRGQTMGNGGENSYDGGIGLAQFLAEALHSQAVEEKPGSLRAERPAEMDTSAADAGKEEGAWKEREEREREQALAEERERERRTEQESAAERERGTELSHKMVHSKHASDVKHLNKAHKDHDHHNIQASISSVLHTVKDFFFGKSKKDSHDHRENEEGEFYNPDDHVQLDHTPASSENGDPEVLQEFPPMKSIDDCGFGSNERSHSALERNEGSVLNEGFTSALEKKLEVNSLNPTIQEQAFSKVASAEEPRELLPRNEVRAVAIEREFEMEKGSKKVGELDELNSHSGASKIENASVSEEPIKAANPDATERHLEGPIGNVPEIQIFNSVIEDIPDIKLTVPEVRLNEQIIIPNADVMQSEIKEPSMTGSPVTEGIPTQTSMLNHDNVPSTEKTQEVAQLDDKEKMHNSEQPFKKTSEPVNPPQMDYATIPIINVSCTDDNVSVKHLDTPQPGEAPMVPLFVVPPISVICDDSTPENKLPTQNERAGRDSSAPTLRGEKGDFEGNITIESEKTHNKKQNIEAGTKSTVENTPSVLSEALMPTEVITNVLSLGKTSEDIATETLKMKPLKKARTESDITVEERQTDKPAVERLDLNTPALPPLSPASLRKFVSKPAPVADAQAAAAVPAITVGDSQNDKTGEEMSGGSTPTSSLSCESSPRLKRRDSLSLIRSATPEELASGARRKIFIPKAKGEDGEGGGGFGAGALDAQGKKETPYMSPSQARRAALLQAPTAPGTPPMERRSPLLSRRKATLEVPKVVEETSTEETASTKPEDKPAEKLDPFKAPQVIRKIRGEPFPDASGHLKLWCQFFNVLSDSTIKWYRDEEEILEVKKSGGDESQVALAIVLASSHDCGVYGCTIKNEYGTDTTDFLLSVDILSEILLRDDLEVGEEIEMTPMLFTKGLVDPGCWGEKFFGRIMTKETHLGEGCGHKASKVKVIYGLDPVFDSGTTCIIKVQNPIAYGTKEESNLTERNLEITKQECKIQNMIREYCKIFAAEARVIENFGFSLEIIPQYLMYRPANSVPYATVEVDLDGVFLKYCMMDTKGRLITRTVSEVEQKCSTFQHWIHQWTHGNLLVTHLEGVGTKLTNVRVVTKSKGYQGLTECGSPKVFEQFLTHHQCNYYCGLLSLRPLKTMDSLQQPTKIKGSRSPLLNRKLGSSSPQLLRKGTNSPQMSRKATSSPKVTRKAQETEDNKSNAKPKPADTLEVVQMR
ncbi:alpha-protein kinase 3 [Polymixia lowei]